jgi:hypothetical protein
MTAVPRLSPKAIIIGFIADIGGSAITAVSISTVAVLRLVHHGLSYEGAAAVVTRSGWFLPMSMVVGLLFDMVGGYVAATLATTAALRNAFAVGGCSCLLVLISAGLSLGNHPLWYIATAIVLVIPCALLGGYLRLATRAQRSGAS